ncbi:T9SS type A sorting domain-containing protein [bacterium]
MNDGYALAFGSIWQGGRADDGTTNVMAVFKTTNTGASWNRYYLSTDLGYVYSLAVDPTDSDIVYAGGNQYTTSWEAALFKTTNGGTSWTDLSASFTGSEIKCICIDPNDHDRILVGGSGVWVSTDGGTSWAAPTFSPTVQDLTPDPATSSVWYMGTTNGMYQSVDGGYNWTQFNNGLDNTYVQCIALDAANQIVYAGTNGGGVYRYIIESGVEDDDPALPTEITLHQNYPNPFNMQTEIVYEIPVSGMVHLAIYNVQGRLIRTLVDGHELSGRKTVSWDGRDMEGKEVSSGMYICRLRTDDFIDMKKMILQK